MTYVIRLNDYIIATTDLERADAPMGVVMGKIKFANSGMGFDYLLSLTKKHSFRVNDLDEKHKYINFEVDDTVTVHRADGLQLKGIGCYIEGMECDWFDITIVGIGHPFYREEFPHHVKAYDEQFTS